MCILAPIASIDELLPVLAHDVYLTHGADEHDEVAHQHGGHGQVEHQELGPDQLLVPHGGQWG